MTIENTHIEGVLKKLLQKNLALQFKNKLFKQGKLLLFQQNNYHISLLLHSSKKGDIKLEIPIPFNIEEWFDDNLVYFDYRLTTLAMRQEKLLQQLKDIKPVKVSKYYNSILEILILPDGEIL